MGRDIIPHGWSTAAITSEEEAVATYIQSGQPAILRTHRGAGHALSSGLEYGYAYSRRTMPIVPPSYERAEMHPVVPLDRTPVKAEIGLSSSALPPKIPGVETAIFGDKAIIVNHRSSPIDERPEHTPGAYGHHGRRLAGRSLCRLRGTHSSGRHHWAASRLGRYRSLNESPTSAISRRASPIRPLPGPTIQGTMCRAAVHAFTRASVRLSAAVTKSSMNWCLLHDRCVHGSSAFNVRVS